jgi:hypothetical protein
MRDLLSKLDRILLEDTTLQDLKKEPLARDPVIAKAIKDKEQEENQEESFGKERDTRRRYEPDEADKAAEKARQEKKRKDLDAAMRSTGGDKWGGVTRNGKKVGEESINGLNKQAGAKVWRTAKEGSDQELYGLRVGDTVRVELKGREEQGDIIDIYPDTMEVELLLKGPEAGRTITVDVRDVEYFEDVFQVGDEFGISVLEDFEIGAEIVDILEDGVVVELDDVALEYLSKQGFTFEEGELVEDKKKGLDGKACWKGYRYAGTKMKGGKRVDDCVKVKESGLQYYTGKKKYGKEGMAALAAAGRKGASEEELGRIKDRYKKEDAGSGDELKIKIENEVFWVKNTPEGPMLYGEDIEGYWTAYDKEGWLDFEANIETGEFTVTRVDLGANHGSESDWDESATDEYIEDIISQVRKSYGTTWEEIKDEVEGGVSVEKEDLELEAKYQGREVPLGKPMAGDVKKSKVYVKNPQGNVVKVNFGDKKMRIKKSNPKRRKSFRARHNCANPGPRHRARYWSCRSW